ncbi:MAG: hypothetical protein HKN70_04580, partial [Gammaproteobacteria bacterium]|nr:hypothetical protein [Gammaproteobacteria bacterium]
VRRAGVGTTYGLMVAIIFSGIVVLGLWPVIVTLALVQILFRSGQFGTMKPCYDMLFSAVSEEQKYKSKNFIDTSVVRSAYLIGGWFFTLLKFIGLSIANITAVAAIGMLLLGYLGVDLGRRFERRGSRPTQA